MAILKCKVCGGNVEPIEGQHYGTCDSCGNTMTLPDASEEKIVNLFNRANQYRMQSEFDKALATYENILIENPNNAEAHWGCVLSKFGVEYVEDPKTHKHIPTLHRVQKESVLVDLEYKAALDNADYSARELYEKEAAQIEAIQKKILSVANNEAPYDIFICYKESDIYGKRTMDSVLAQDIYQQLSGEGYRVFFSRITLEDKIGVEYEPYIFSALNSAKIMLVVGTKPEHFNAVWVKNEWARFLALAKNDSNRVLIPCYRDMDAYELPEALAIFQSQDMSRIGFIQDLKYGISKILAKEETPISKVITSAPGVSVDALLKRAMMSLEDAEWDKASELLEQVLNQDPENAVAYVGKLMAEVKVNKEENLGKRAIRLSDSINYQKAVRFADDTLKSKLQQYNNEATTKYDQMVFEKNRKNLEEETAKLTNMLDVSKKRTEDTLKTVTAYKKTCKVSIPIAIIGFVIMLMKGFDFVSWITVCGFMIAGVGVATVLIVGIYYFWCSKDYIQQKENDENLERKIQTLKEQLSKLS